MIKRERRRPRRLKKRDQKGPKGTQTPVTISEPDVDLSIDSSAVPEAMVVGSKSISAKILAKDLNRARSLRDAGSELKKASRVARPTTAKETVASVIRLAGGPGPFRQIQAHTARLKSGETSPITWHRFVLETIGTTDEALAVLASFIRLLPMGSLRTQLVLCHRRYRSSRDSVNGTGALGRPAIGRQRSTASSVGSTDDMASVRCPVCDSNDASVLLGLTCGHTICAPCLQKWQEVGGSNADKCAVCRAPLGFADEQVDNSSPVGPVEEDASRAAPCDGSRSDASKSGSRHGVPDTSAGGAVAARLAPTSGAGAGAGADRSEGEDTLSIDGGISDDDDLMTNDSANDAGRSLREAYGSTTAMQPGSAAVGETEAESLRGAVIQSAKERAAARHGSSEVQQEDLWYEGMPQGAGSGKAKKGGNGKRKGGKGRRKQPKGSILTAADLAAMAKEGREQLDMQMAYARFTDEPMEDPAARGIAWARTSLRSTLGGVDSSSRAVLLSGSTMGAGPSSKAPGQGMDGADTTLRSGSSGGRAQESGSWRSDDATDQRPLVLFEDTKVPIPRFPSEEFRWQPLMDALSSRVSREQLSPPCAGHEAKEFLENERRRHEEQGLDHFLAKMRVPDGAPPGRDSTSVAGVGASASALPRPPMPAGEQRPVLVLFRQDLRIADNPALCAAAASGRPVVPLFVHEPDDEMCGWPMGGAIKHWTHHSLASLQSDLEKRYGTRLMYRNGSRRTSSGKHGTIAHVLEVAAAVQAAGVVWNRVYEPWRWRRDVAMRQAIEASLTIPCLDLKAVLLFDPVDVDPEHASGEELIYGYGSVGWFRKACRGLDVPKPLEVPDSLPPPAWLSRSTKDAAKAAAACERDGAVSSGEFLHWCDCGLAGVGYAALPRRRTDGKLIDWAVGIRASWDMGEGAGLASLDRFLSEGAEHFESKDRFRADKSWTAQISPYMQVGELSPRTVYHAAARARGKDGAKTFLRRLAWRDLAFWTLCRFPNSAQASVKPWMDGEKWTGKKTWLRAWQRGRTGFPLVDAAMRQLWATGWMPNYLRHVVAGFLVEYLHIDWREGLQWFHDTLVDSSVPINAFMWQNGGRCGTDIWNFVMHPVWAAKTADPEGEYVRQWCPELRRLPAEYIHCPWQADSVALAGCGVRLIARPSSEKQDEGGHKGGVKGSGWLAGSWWSEREARVHPEQLTALDYAEDGRGGGGGVHPRDVRITVGGHHGRYVRRVIEDLDKRRKVAARAVLAIRRGPARDAVLFDGNERLPLGDGRCARCICRVDYRLDSDELVTKMTPDARRDPKRRQRKDPLSLAMADAVRQTGYRPEDDDPFAREKAAGGSGPGGRGRGGRRGRGGGGGRGRQGGPKMDPRDYAVVG